MLQEILEKMYIDPELLAELSEDQKQILFVKMRQEQVRRWKLHDEKMEEEERKKMKKKAGTGKKKVTFMQGRDGCEWVWVMGDHQSDKSIDQILEEESQETARKLAEAEALAIREKEELERHKEMEMERQRIIKENEAMEAEIKRKQEEAALYQSIKEARLAVEKMEIQKKKLEEEEKKRLVEIEQQEMRAKRRSREFTDSFREKRSSEIFTNLQQKRLTLEKLAEEGAKEVESSWMEQEKKAKEADKQIREMARKARVEYKESLKRSLTVMEAARALNAGKSGQVKKPPLPPKQHLMVTSAPGLTSRKPRPLRPRGREMIINWFQKEEEVKGTGLDPETKTVAPWFHGIINRAAAEAALVKQENGAFLIRVSERVWGYTLSFKEANRFKHFLIDASDMGYQFFGADQTVHASLADLVIFHTDNPITISGQEKLVHPCGQIVTPPDYSDLFTSKDREITSL